MNIMRLATALEKIVLDGRFIVEAQNEPFAILVHHGENGNCVETLHITKNEFDNVYDVDADKVHNLLHAIY